MKTVNEMIVENKDRIIAALRLEPMLIRNVLAARMNNQEGVCYCVEGVILKEIGFTVTNEFEIKRSSPLSDRGYAFTYSMELRSELYYYFSKYATDAPRVKAKDLYDFLFMPDNYKTEQEMSNVFDLREYLKTIGGMSPASLLQLDLSLNELNDSINNFSPNLMANILEYCWRNL